MLAIVARELGRPFAALILWLTISAGSHPASTPNDVPRVTVDSTIHDVGKIPRGTVVTETFRLHNAGSVPLRIDSMRFSTPGLRARAAALIKAEAEHLAG